MKPTPNVHALKTHATRVDLPVSESPLRCGRGERWRSESFVVRWWGLEWIGRGYHIEARRLWAQEETYGWVRTFANKRVNLEEFAEALRVARIFHAKKAKRA